MPTSTLYTCYRCKKEFNFNNIKYDEDNSLICNECLEKKQKLKKKNLELEKPEEMEKVNFICLNCRFKFSITTGSQKIPKCPYCGKTKLIQVKKYKDENGLINDSMDHSFDY